MYRPVVDVIKLDFPKIKKLNKVCSADWTCTKMLKQLRYFYVKLLSMNVILFKAIDSFKWTIFAVSA